MANCTSQYTKIYCEKFATELNLIHGTLLGVENLMRLPIIKLKKMMNDLVSKVPSDAGKLSEQLSKLNLQIDSKIPGQDCVNSLFDIAKQCDLIKQDIQIKGLDGLKFDLGGPINNLINQTLSDFKKYM